MREVKLPSGATLKVQPSPFAISKALYQALLRELKAVSLKADTDMAMVYKDLFCAGFTSPEVERWLWECFKRCTYNRNGADLKIDESTFEPVECRDDFITICVEVTKENVFPFVKSLYAEFQRIIETKKDTPA